jgi:ribonuclease Y
MNHFVTFSLIMLGTMTLFFLVLRARWRSSILHFDLSQLEQSERKERRRLKRLSKRKINRIEQVNERAKTREVRDEARAGDLTEQEARSQIISSRLEERASQQEERDQTIKLRRKEGQQLKSQVKRLKQTLKRNSHEMSTLLEERAQVTSSEVIQNRVNTLCAQAEVDVQQRTQRSLVEAEAYKDSRAAELMSLGRQRYYDPQPAERLVGHVELPQSQKISEALLHEGGELLSLLHEVTQVEFLFDEQNKRRLALRNSPETYTRELARLTFQRWISSGQLNEKALRRHHDKARQALEREARRAGHTAAEHLGLKKIHPEILFLVGKLLFRTSYTQNQWQHAIEASELCGMMAAELNMDVNLARRATLLHDIGKVLWVETEAAGSHAVSGAVFAREHGEIPEVIHPIGAHHHDEAPSTPLAYLVIAADTLSGARPGARRETSEAFSQHVAQLDQLCGELSGIRQHMIIQGGREVRLQVYPQRYSDFALTELTEEVAAEIEDQCVFPGQIKVTALREVISTSVAHARLRDQRARAIASNTARKRTGLGWGGERGVNHRDIIAGDGARRG